MSDGPLWTKMRAQPSRSVVGITKVDIPTGPGVYSFLLDGEPIYVGRADELQDRNLDQAPRPEQEHALICLRRNIADELGIVKANDILKRRYRLMAKELATVRTRIEEGEVSWIAVATKDAAIQRERDLKRERMPQLTRQ